MKKIRKNRLSRKAGTSKSKVKAGLPPGSLVHIGEKYTDNCLVELITYNENKVEKHVNENPEIIFQQMQDTNRNWINIVGLQNIKLVETVGKEFKLHSLLLEDVLNTEQRPKSDEYEDHLFFTLKTLNRIEDNEIVYEQMSFVLGKNYLISFQEREGDMFDQLRERMNLPDSKLRRKDIDYLFYRLVDTIVDSYYIVLEHIGEQLEKLEDNIYSNPTQKLQEQVQDLKKELIFLRKTVYPLREAVKKTMIEPSLIKDDTRKYLADVYDHTIQVFETVESYHDLATSLMDTYMTSVSNRINEVMQVLTIISTIFIPLTFIVGLYGMNFVYMPELEWKYGYPAVWGVMLTISILLIIYFRKKKWL